MSKRFFSALWVLVGLAWVVVFVMISWWAVKALSLALIGGR